MRASYTRHALSAAPGLIIATALLLLLVSIVGQLLVGQSGAFSLPSRTWQTLYTSLLQAGLSTAASLLMGISLAWALSYQRAFFGRSTLLVLLSASLVLPTLVVVLGLVSVFGRAGYFSEIWLQLGGETRWNIYGLSGIVLAHSYFNGGFSARQLLLQLEAIPAQKRKLAHSLNLSPWRRFWVLEWPALSGSVLTLGTTIFLLCFTSFAIVLVLGGSPRYNTLEVAIYEALKLDYDPIRAVSIALLQLSICALLVYLSSIFRRPNNFSSTGFSPPWTQSVALDISQRLLIGLFSTLLILPLIAILSDGLQADLTRLSQDPQVLRATLTSLILASTSAILVLLITLAIVRTQCALTSRYQLGLWRHAKGLRALLSFSSTLYLAVPSLILGLGFFLIARTLPGGLALWSSSALLVANVLMCLPFTLALLLPAALKMTDRYDRVTRSLGLRGLQRWRHLDWPLLRRPLAQVVALSFCLSMGDLGVIALFGNNDLITLPWLLYQKFGSYRTDDAAGIALILLTIVLFMFLSLPKIFTRKDADA